ncbi:hypothetical protein AALO_G00044740 [Alosa alosa]|uniref:Uncharacterized protein n=1 Tax=Alosa alosa TaxID=278164 RepID=A0AAV6H8Z1_9TELE|nr:hypothetical protein AALO_G00044740 [Alosa alosa]
MSDCHAQCVTLESPGTGLMKFILDSLSDHIKTSGYFGLALGTLYSLPLFLGRPVKSPLQKSPQLEINASRRAQQVTRAAQVHPRLMRLF